MRKQISNLLLGLMGCLMLSTSLVADMQEVMQRFQQEHPNAKFIGAQFYEVDNFFEEAGTTSTIWGDVLCTGTTQIDSAWNHVNELSELLGEEIGEFVPKVQADGNVMIGVMYDRDTETYGFSTFRFDQHYNGIPVFRSGVGFLVRNDNDNSLMMSSFNVRDMKGFNVGPVADVEVTAAMLDSVGELMGSSNVSSVLEQDAELEIETTEVRFVIYAGANEGLEEPQLAVEFMATRGSVTTYPDYQKYLVVASAATGEILMSENQIHQVDLDGNVSGRATSGLSAIECSPEANFALPYAQVTIAGGNSAFADENGDFTIPNNGSGPVTVTSRLRGQFFEVRDQAAGDAIPQISQTVTPPGPVNFVHNPTNNNVLSTANVNTYLESNIVRDFTLFYAPNYPVIANQNFFDINTNIGSNCNAFYDGFSINFFTAGGGCNNTAFSDVVYHEYGHHLVQVTGNGQGQLGEGAGDVIGQLIQDDPVLGRGFQGNCNFGIRDARNFRSYPCNGEIHDCGQLISGCVWDLRNELIVTEPVNYRDISADLFVNMLIVRGQQQQGNDMISPEITAIYLTLDEGEHCAEIVAAFGAHNMDPPGGVNFLDFSFPTGRSISVDPLGGLAFGLQVDDNCEAVDLSTITLQLQRGQGNETFNLSGTGNVFDVVFPEIDCGTNFTYYFTAQTTAGSTVVEPAGANTNSANRFTGISATALTNQFLDNAQTNMGWTVSGNANDGQWNRGVPAGGGDRADPAVDGDGSGACYLTDNADGNSDVDGGTTILTSPVLDATGDGDAVLTYWRWFHNAGNTTAVDDSFIVEISNNGTTWVDLETLAPNNPQSAGGWNRVSVMVSDFVVPTSTVQVRFIASDMGEGSIVEAGVDGVSIDLVECGPPPTTVIPPANLTFFRGVQNGGITADLELSDDVRVSVQPGFTLNSSEAPVWLLMDAILPFTPETLNVDIESNANTPGLTKTTEAFNFTTGVLDVVDTAVESFNTDSVVSVDLTGDIADYVQAGSNSVLIRIGWRRTGFTILFPWEVRVDQMNWTLNQ